MSRSLTNKTALLGRSTKMHCKKPAKALPALTAKSSRLVREVFDSLSDTSNTILDTDMPSLGDRLGAGKFAEAFRAKHDSETVIKKLKYWKPGFQTRFTEIYKVIESGRPFEPNNKPNPEDEQFLFMIAMEFRNLKAVGELQAPQLDRFCGWFQCKYIHGTPIWETSEYKHFAFTVPFQNHVKRAFHLAVDRLERAVKEFGIEHR